MSKHDQCPSTRGTQAPATTREFQRVGGTGQKLWKSVDEWADTPEFRDFVEREFPSGASELLSTSRRSFMKVMGAGLALAGAATLPGCRRPEHLIMPFSKDPPEEIITGKPLYYATSMHRPGGGVEGLLVETHDGRPTKIEGNPLHPLNQGKSTVWSQSSVLNLYDPDRPTHPTFLRSGVREVATWDDFRFWWNNVARLDEKFAATGGRGLAFVVDRTTSPTRRVLRDQIMARYPNAIWAVWDPANSDERLEATRLAFGSPHREMLALDRARVVVTLGRDFVNSACASEPMGIKQARDFARTRTPMHAGDPMSRLYAIESFYSMTGGQADHRLAIAPTRIAAATVLLARAVLARLGTGGQLASALAGVAVPEGEDISAEFIEAAADDLVEHRGEGLVVIGPEQPAAVQAVVHALNAALGNIGRTVSYSPIDARSDEAASSLAGIAAVSSLMGSGAAEAIICINTNPVYNAPADLSFAERYARVPVTISLNSLRTETGERSTWRLNGTHDLEQWGDTQAPDGTIAPIQPMIAPLYEPAMSDIELLAWLTGDEAYIQTIEPPADAPANGATDGATNGEAQPERRVSGHKVVRAAWQKLGVLGGDFEKSWRRALHDGVVPGAQVRIVTPQAGQVMAAAASAAGRIRVEPMPTQERMAVEFRSGHIAAGEFANNPWLMELPATATTVAWDNPVLVSPATAGRLKLMPQPYTQRQIPLARRASVTVDGRTIDAPVWICPGMPDNTMVLTVGYGRTDAGQVAREAGVDVSPLRTTSAMAMSASGSLRRVRGTYTIASTQNHWSLEGRTTIFRQIDKPYFDKHAAKPIKVIPDKIYGTFESKLNLAEQMGELAHTPANISIYDNPYNDGPADPGPSNVVMTPRGPVATPQYSTSPQWGMSIDMSSCTGCGACTIACQAENNIPSVGKNEVAKGREMTWIRVDRYFTGDDPFSPDQMVHQPVACVHCENAPCEVVCPVNATVHGPEGLNYMVYNRCIGTRYCSNNCPYKVRRFNFFEYGDRPVNGEYAGEDLIKVDNVNLIPPRLRKKISEAAKMQKNPDVTIRSRGVMEKCTYCLQRINRARYEVKLQDLAGFPDGFFQVACQQACPSDAISFGDLLDIESDIRTKRENHRSYLLLGYLNTRPRTTHMLRVTNPNPRLRKPVDPLDYGGGHGGGGSGDHGNGQGDTEHSLLNDPRRRVEDDGYLGSLRVLARSMGANA